MTDQERRLLERLSAAGKPTRLLGEELQVAKSLEADGLVLLIAKTTDAAITPKRRHALAGLPRTPKPRKKPFGFLE